jgi:hypothetical protein
VGVLADEPGGQVAQAVAAGVRDSGVQFRDAGLGRAPPLRGLLPGALVRADTPAGLALQATQLLEGDLQVARVGDDLPGGQHRQGRDPEVDTHHQRPPWRVTVAERIRPVPRSTWRASVRVDSWVRTRPMRGSVTCRRSPSGRPNAPVVNQHDRPCRLPLKRGNRTVGPRRVPFFDAFQLPNAVARFARPDEYASFEFSAHGAMAVFAWFQVFRRL